jgi:hypothetical protein
MCAVEMYDDKVPVGERMKGKNVCVINRSEVVGRPLAAMLANDGADVYSIDISSTYLMKRGKMIEVCESASSSGAMHAVLWSRSFFLCLCLCLLHKHTAAPYHGLHSFIGKDPRKLLP